MRWAKLAVQGAEQRQPHVYATTVRFTLSVKLFQRVHPEGFHGQATDGGDCGTEFTLTTVPVLQSPPVTPARKMDTCSVPGEKLAKVIVATPKVPVSGPNTLNAAESKVVVTLYGLLGITTSTKVARRVSIDLRHSQMEFTEFYSLRVC
jgi:hypothetical protein